MKIVVLLAVAVRNLGHRKVQAVLVLVLLEHGINCVKKDIDSHLTHLSLIKHLLHLTL
jgi:hypothetical protein